MVIEDRGITMTVLKFPTPQHESITCPNCKGSGVFRVWHGTTGTAHSMYSCDPCKGAGKILSTAQSASQSSSEQKP